MFIGKFHVNAILAPGGVLGGSGGAEPPGESAKSLIVTESILINIVFFSRLLFLS